MDDTGLETSAAIVAEGRKLAVDALYSEKGHFAAARCWRRLNYFLGIPSVVLGATAGASIVSDLGDNSKLAAGMCALLAAALTALNTFLNPAERASQHHRAGVEYGRLRRLIRQFVQINPRQSPEATELRRRLDELTEKVGTVQAEALPIPGYAHRRAYAEIQKGSADYTPKELDTAAGPAT